MRPLWASEDKNMQKDNRNEEAVSPVIATILMVAITVVLAGVLYVWASQLAEGNTDGDFSMYDFAVTDASDAVSADSGEALVYVAMDTGDDLSGQQSSYKCPLTAVPTANAQHLAKQQAQPVSLPTTVTETGALVKRSLLAKAQMTSVLQHVPFRSRSSTRRATSSSTSRVKSASLDYGSRTTLS